MKCSQCASCETKVIESRDVTDSSAVRRRRECIDCEYRFTTYEREEKPQLIVIKNNGDRELYKREKILAGLYRACEKTSISTYDIDRVVEKIENQLYANGDQEVQSSIIGDIAMQQLRLLDEVAYVRFASVYRRFTDIAGFEKELLRIKSKEI